MTSAHRPQQPSRAGERAPDDPVVRLDARSLRGLAHPLRLRLLGLLREHGPSTATSLAHEVGESSGVTSYHLRQLAAYGFVVDDSEGRPSRRERWWRAAHRTTVLEDLPEKDVETTLLVDEYLRAVAGAYADRLLRYADGFDSVRSTLGEEWAEVSDFSDYLVVVTPEQAREVDQQIHALLAALPRHDPMRPVPEGTARVVVQLQVMPTPTPRRGEVPS